MNGHHAAVWAISVSSDGAFVVSSSQDRSIRFWRRTDEQLFLEEERERALESTFEVDDKREILVNPAIFICLTKVLGKEFDRICSSRKTYY